MMQNQSKDPDWQALFDKPEDELLLALGQALPSTSLSMMPRSSEALRKKAEMWLQEKREAICTSVSVRNAVQSHDQFIIAAAIADAIGGNGAATAAVLVTKKGIEVICEDAWSQASHHKNNIA